ncbi:MAG: outer membrane lipoprotein carrier protein LolA [Bradyrhizobiaceae bacterium]|nr:MAG: outer membrane lipoprotein carrier protein LolA [Bradyrhizobiaceae bacterium]
MLAAPVMAQGAPAPKPAPKAASTPPASLGQRQQVTPEDPPNPILPDLRNLLGMGNNTGAARGFDDSQRKIAAKVSTYLSSIQSMSGNFVQVGPDGSRTTGDLYLQKPGKVRFEYDPPSPIAIVADGTSVIVRDNKLATQDVYPLSQTPLRYLLADHIDLLRDTNVVSISADDVYVSIVIEEKQPLVGTSRLMLMVGAKDNKLKQWTVTDPQGYDTTVAVYNLDTGKKLDPGLFKIDYTYYQGSGNN